MTHNVEVKDTVVFYEAGETIYPCTFPHTNHEALLENLQEVVEQRNEWKNIATKLASALRDAHPVGRRTEKSDDALISFDAVHLGTGPFHG